MDKYIVIAGNIGAGKSTLVEKLCESLNWKPYYEPVTENPYLRDFYNDMEKWAFHSQLFFLSDRMAMHKELQNYRGNVVQDRSIYEDADIMSVLFCFQLRFFNKKLFYVVASLLNKRNESDIRGSNCILCPSEGGIHTIKKASQEAFYFNLGNQEW